MYIWIYTYLGDWFVYLTVFNLAYNPSYVLSQRSRKEGSINRKSGSLIRKTSEVKGFSSALRHCFLLSRESFLLRVISLEPPTRIASGFVSKNSERNPKARRIISSLLRTSNKDIHISVVHISFYRSIGQWNPIRCFPKTEILIVRLIIAK